MRAKRKRARGQFPRRRAGWAAHVLSFMILLVAVDRVTAARAHVFFMSPQGAALSHKQKVQGKASALCCFAVLICAACVCRGVVEVVALLGFIQRGLCCSSAVWAIVDQVAAAINDKLGSAARRHQRPTGRDT